MKIQTLEMEREGNRSCQMALAFSAEKDEGSQREGDSRCKHAQVNESQGDMTMHI